MLTNVPEKDIEINLGLRQIVNKRNKSNRNINKRLFFDDLKKGDITLKKYK